MKTGVTVLDAMTRKPVFVDVSLSVYDCARLMSREKVGSVLVREKGAFKGIVTEKDLLEKVLARGLSARQVEVRNVMSTKIISIAPDEDLYNAIVKMNDEGVRRLPVLHQGELVGLLTVNDVVKIEPQLFDYLVEKLRVRDKPLLRTLKHGTCEQCGHFGNLSSVGEQQICSMCKAS